TWQVKSVRFRNRRRARSLVTCGRHDDRRWTMGAETRSRERVPADGRDARARLALAAHDTTRAAAELRTAAAYVRVQSSAADSDGWTAGAVQASLEDLERELRISEQRAP